MVLIATQVKRRRGTTAENDAFTGAEGEITVDTEKHQLRVHDGTTQGGFVIGSGGSGRNIGDIFYTTRTDSGLGGAVECNGGTYNTEDYTGTGSIGELLAGGKLPYVSLAEYATLLSTNGIVGVFGWDGGTSFRVPTLQDVFIECGQAAQLGNYMPAGLPNITGKWVVGKWGDVIVEQSGAFYNAGGSNNVTSGGSISGNTGLGLDASRSSSIYGNSDTVQPKAIKYRAMVQLFNGTTDEAVATCTGVLSDVAGLKDMSNITADGKETAVGWGMPDYTAGVQITTATQTAPKNGWLIGGLWFSGNNVYFALEVNGIEVNHSPWSSSAWGVLNASIPIKAGQTYRCYGNGTMEQNHLYFYPNNE